MSCTAFFSAVPITLSPHCILFINCPIGAITISCTRQIGETFKNAMNQEYKRSLWEMELESEMPKYIPASPLEKSKILKRLLPTCESNIFCL